MVSVLKEFAEWVLDSSFEIMHTLRPGSENKTRKCALSSKCIWRENHDDTSK